MTNPVHDDEAEFHDAWAVSLSPAQVPVRETFEAATAPENRCILDWLGDVKGLRLLDLGCGAGESAVYFSMLGARVTAVDVSPRMIDVARRTARFHGVDPTFVIMAADELEFPDASFDVVYGANVLHHVDRRRCLDHVRRVLVAGGRAAFWDPLVHNPVIKLYRLLAGAVRTKDEAPLRMSDLADFRERFERVQHAEFWLLTQWIFLQFFLIERVHPSKERYWKKILDEHERLTPLFNRLSRWDERLLAALPFLRRYCWNMAVMMTKEDSPIGGRPSPATPS